MSVKRVHYFDHQFLKVHDFQAEQNYHVEMRRRHNHLLHGWGVVEGLEVGQKGPREITIGRGTAIDGEGREIIVEGTITRDISFPERGTHLYVAIGYRQEESDHYSKAGVEGYTRLAELHEISERKEPARDGSVVTLARVHLNENGHIHRIETNVRTVVPTRGSAVGWVRLPFKPVRLEQPMEKASIDGKSIPLIQVDRSIEFIIEAASAYSEEQGGCGSMQIPVPPGAVRVTRFRVCGTTQKKIEFEWVRTGWNPDENKGEHKVLVKRTLDKTGEHEHFDENVAVADELQHLGETQSLAVSVVAEGRARIWLVAAHFE